LAPVNEHIAVSLHQAVPNDFYSTASAIENEKYVVLHKSLRETAKTKGLQCLDEVQPPTPGAPYCGAIPDRNWIVLPGGRITKCTDKFHDKSSDCGEIHSDGTLTLNENARDWLSYSPFTHDICSKCDVLPICMGGCRVVPFFGANGDRCMRKTVLEYSILEHGKEQIRSPN
jgi:uncharacterized protein